MCQSTRPVTNAAGWGRTPAGGHAFESRPVPYVQADLKMWYLND